jgi:hypothetical protein
VVDAREYTLGRLASRVATILKGKHKPIFTPHSDNGDHVVVLHAAEVKLTGKKLHQKTYFRHTGYPSGGRLDTLEEMMVERPTGTVNLNVVNAAGDISSVTTTSGLAWKIPGRVGDSPIVGAGQYTDNEIGAAGSTGRGESNIMVCGGFLTVSSCAAHVADRRMPRHAQAGDRDDTPAAPSGRPRPSA